jgi:protein required for attachment to host cells
MVTDDEKIIRTWVLVADSAQARLFLSYPGQEHWFELRTFNHPQSRAKSTELYTAMPPMEEGTLPKEREAEVFARQLCEYLDLNFSRANYERLILVAPPEFLGLLRSNMSKQVQRVVGESVTKDLVAMRKEELEARIGH